MQDDGQIQLATNIREYAQESFDYFTRAWGLECRQSKIIVESNEPRTLFEKKYLERGEPVYDMIFKKKPLVGGTRGYKGGI